MRCRGTRKRQRVPAHALCIVRNTHGAGRLGTFTGYSNAGARRTGTSIYRSTQIGCNRRAGVNASRAGNMRVVESWNASPSYNLAGIIIIVNRRRGACWIPTIPRRVAVLALFMKARCQLSKHRCNSVEDVVSLAADQSASQPLAKLLLSVTWVVRNVAFGAIAV